VALAIFPVEEYTGTITTDLFAEDETSYFDDAEQFFRLQKAAVVELYRHHLESAAWVKVTEDYRLSDWQYRKAKRKEKGGVLINLSPSGAVEIREGLVKHEIEEATAEAIAENPIAPVKAKAAYSAPLCRYIAHHKTAAVAEILLASSRTAQEVLIVRTLQGLRLHEAFPALAKEEQPQSAYRVLEEQARWFAAQLGFEIAEGESVWCSLPPPFTNELALYEAVRGLSDHDLAGLQTLLAALSFGQGNCDRRPPTDRARKHP
jgi:ParB family chromosome partitioning protein